MATYKYTNTVSKTSSDIHSKYPNWVNSTPNLQTFIAALNLSNPITKCQFELVYTRWPRTIFFAKNVTIPGIEANTIDIPHAGFNVPIATHLKYNSTEISFTIIADKEGLHYYDWRNMVMQSAHPLVAGDAMAMVGNTDNLNISDYNDDCLEIRLRNDPTDENLPHHRWIVHNFRPTKIGEIDLTHDNASFVEFDITGTFTHIYYDAGHANKKSSSSVLSSSSSTSSTSSESNSNSSNTDSSNQTNNDDLSAQEKAEYDRQQQMLADQEALQDKINSGTATSEDYDNFNKKWASEDASSTESKSIIKYPSSQSDSNHNVRSIFR